MKNEELENLKKLVEDNKITNLYKEKYDKLYNTGNIVTKLESDVNKLELKNVKENLNLNEKIIELIKKHDNEKKN